MSENVTRQQSKEEKKFREELISLLGVDAEEITDNASFVDDLGADSLDFIELVMAVEEAYDIDVPEDEAENIKTYGDLITFAEKLRKSK